MYVIKIGRCFCPGFPVGYAKTKQKADKYLRAKGFWLCTSGVNKGLYINSRTRDLSDWAELIKLEEVNDESNSKSVTLIRMCRVVDHLHALHSPG